MAGLSSQWRYSHNYRHHVNTNVVGVDDDLGYGVLRVTRDQEWKPSNPLPAAAKCVAGDHLRVGHRPARPLLRTRTRGQRRAEVRPRPRAAAQDRASDGQGLRAVPGAEPQAVASDPRRQRHGQRAAQHLGIRGDLLRPLRRRRREVRARDPRRRDQTRVVSTTDVGQRQLRRRTRDGVHERQPLLPDRAPSVSRSAEQPLRRDRHAGARAVRHLRPAVHDGSPGQAVPDDGAHACSRWRLPDRFTRERLSPVAA